LAEQLALGRRGGGLWWERKRRYFLCMGRTGRRIEGKKKTHPYGHLFGGKTLLTSEEGAFQIPS